MTATSKPAQSAGSTVGRYRPVARAAASSVVGDVLDVGLRRQQALDPVLVDLVADDVVADLDGPHGEGQADVALTDDRRPSMTERGFPPVHRRSLARTEVAR